MPEPMTAHGVATNASYTVPPLRLNYTAREMMALPAAAPEYARDLALPPHERELTAFIVLNDVERVYDGELYTTSGD